MQGKAYGLGDLRVLTDTLKKLVEARLSVKGRLTAGAPDAAMVNLALVDAKPNRPTFRGRRERTD